MSAAPTAPDPIRDWPLWWFARLEAAIERGDFQTAAQAQRELERLGVSVQYRGRRPARQGSWSGYPFQPSGERGRHGR
jgi:hypothetical protein